MKKDRKNSAVPRKLALGTIELLRVLGGSGTSIDRGGGASLPPPPPQPQPQPQPEPSTTPTSAVQR